jgi:hypothetical protein
MAVTAFPLPGFSGDAVRLPPGIFHGEALRDLPSFSDGGRARSLRVDPGTLVLLGPGPTPPRRGGRFLAGPAEVADVSRLGLPSGFGFLQVVPFRPYDSALPPGQTGARLYELPGFAGRRAALWWGDYPASRLSSREVGLPSFESFELAAGAVLLLSAGPALEPDADSLLFVGPASVHDLPREGFSPRSLRLAYSDPFDAGAPLLGRPWLREFYGRPPLPPGLRLPSGGFLPPAGRPFADSLHSGKIAALSLEAPAPPPAPVPAPAPAPAPVPAPAPAPEASPSPPFLALGLLAACLAGAAFAGGGAAGRRAALRPKSGDSGGRPSGR